MLKTPIQTHSGMAIRLTNPFGPIDPKYIDFYRENYNIDFHPGIDLVLNGRRSKSYGTPIVAATDGVVVYERFTKAFGKTSNGIRIVSPDGKFRTTYWHNSKHYVKEGDEVKAGDVIALMGNTGIVSPTPTFKEPYRGTHLHFGVEERGNNMWTSVDPLKHVDLDVTTITEDTGVDSDIPPLAWVVAEITNQVTKLAETIRLIKKSKEEYHG